MFNKQIHINIQFPHSWNQCTTEQLEVIATSISSVAQDADGFHPFEWMDVKALVFLPLSGLERVDDDWENRQVQQDKKETEDLDRVIWVRFTDKWNYDHRSDKGRKQIDKFPLHIWQIYSMIHDHLQWLGEDNDGNEIKPSIYNFPYPEMYCSRISSKSRKYPNLIVEPKSYSQFLFRISSGFNRISLHGCSSLMQDFTWRRYRYAQEFMSAYTRASNALIRLKLHGRSVNEDDIKSAMDRQDELCAKFLSCCFSSRVNVVDKNTGEKSKEYVWVPSMVDNNAIYFRWMSTTVRWQVVMLWWTSMQYYLQQKFPKCFSISDTDINNKKKKLPPNPLELYVRGAATLSKYLGLTEEEVNEQNFQIILQHMNDMAEENERMEKLGKK